MRQGRVMSAIEAGANVLVGFAVAVLVQLVVFPVVGTEATTDQNLKVALTFTPISLVRSYALRRWFETRWARP